MHNGTPSDELSRLLGLGLGDGMPLEGSRSMHVGGDYYGEADDITRSTMMGSGAVDAFNSECLTSGDFYAPEDEAVRGITLPVGDHHKEADDISRGTMMGLDFGKAACLTAGDFYAPEDKVVRGLTLPVGDHMSMDSQIGFGGLGPSGFAMDQKSKGVAFNGFSSEIVEPSTPVAQSMPTAYFSDGDCPLSPPDDEFFLLCATTLYLLCDPAFVLGNCLLDFLLNGVTSSVTKVRPEKFCIKADVFIDNVMCTTKIKVWKQASPGLVAVEFQRRRGSVSTFNSFFERASIFLQSHFSSDGDIPPVSSVLSAPPPLPPSLDMLSKGDATMEIRPILDMARQTHNTPIQAETASMLANLTEDQQKDALRTPEAAQAVTALLKEDATEVALPTARIVLALSKCSGAVPYFIDIGQEKARSGFLDLSIDKICARTSCTLVRRILAQAVATAMDSCVAQLSQDKASQLGASISAAIVAISKERGFPQSLPGAAAHIDVIDQSLQRAATLLSTR